MAIEDARLDLLGREGETDALMTALEAARAGRGGVVVIEGSAGAGKSTLITASWELARALGLRVISARDGELEQSYAFGLVRQLYEPALRAAPGPERARLLAGAAAPAARVLGLAQDEIGTHAAGFAAMHALYWLTAELAEDGPLLVTVDDAHWADPSSLTALDYQARRIADLAVVIIAAFRPDEPGAPMALLDQLRNTADTRIKPAALDRESVAQIVRDRMPSANDEVCDACLAATAGNPLYLQELRRAVGGNGVVPSAEEVRATSVRFLGDRVLRRVERSTMTPRRSHGRWQYSATGHASTRRRNSPACRQTGRAVSPTSSGG